MLSASHDTPPANDFPTQDRVQFVYECMTLRGGHSYANLYGCSCMIDRIAEEMNYEEFVEADSYMRLKNSRGERGGLFRSSSDKARTVRDRYRRLRQEAEKRCFIR